MSEHYLKDILAKGGVTDPDHERDATLGSIQTQLEEAERQFATGRISREVANDAQRELLAVYLEETVNDPEAYRRARKSGEFDRLRKMAGGYTSNESPDA